MRNPFSRRLPDLEPIEVPELPNIDDARAALAESEQHKAEALSRRTHYQKSSDPLVGDIIAAIASKGGAS